MQNRGGQWGHTEKIINNYALYLFPTVHCNLNKYIGTLYNTQPDSTELCVGAI